MGRHILQKHRCAVFLVVAFLYVLTRTPFLIFIYGSKHDTTMVSPTTDMLEISTEFVESPPPPKTLLFVAILSHWKRRKRRDSIRETWMAYCQDTATVECLFFTDFAGTEVKERRSLENEKWENNDTVVMPMSGMLLINVFEDVILKIKAFLNCTRILIRRVHNKYTIDLLSEN